MNMKRMKAWMLCVLMVISVFVCAACGTDKPDETLSKDAEYQVTVVDALGKPYSGVVVRFMKNGQQVAMQVVDANGLAKKTMERGDYTVELMFTGDAADYHYDKDGLSLTAEKTELKVILSNTVGNSQALVASGNDFTAYHVSTGCTYVELVAGMNYFLFTPTESGLYRFSVNEAQAKLGYYGSPYFVQELSIVEVKENTFDWSISEKNIGSGTSGTTVMVLGIASEAVGDAILSIERVGDALRGIEDEEWIVYKTSAELKEFALPSGAVLTDFDLTAVSDTYQLVLNEADGFYHLNSVDGPVVLVRLTEKSDYLESFKKILETSGISRYFFDEDGTFIKKETYDECLTEYFDYVDEEKGVYPLTEDLKYIIQNRGEYAGWWDPQSGVYLFKDENGVPVDGINHEIAWLFMCCYVAA